MFKKLTIMLYCQKFHDCDADVIMNILLLVNPKIRQFLTRGNTILLYFNMILKCQSKPSYVKFLNRMTLFVFYF